jgi:FtsP/CotA-like multicopper oxidase with cupredoxin domain
MQRRSLSRRDLLKMGLLSTGTFLTMPAERMYGRVSAFFDSQLRSPYLKPFVDPLPTLGRLTPITRPADITPYALPYVGAGTQFYEFATAERNVKFHQDLPSTPVWAYVDPNATTVQTPARLITFRFPTPADTVKDPTVKPAIVLGQPAGAGMLVRYHNDLTWAPRDFGYPTLTMHFHGGHQPAGADGFPHDIQNGAGGFPGSVTVKPGTYFDYMYPFRDVGFEDGPETRDERPSFYWFHDHILDFTGPNVYRGLANVVPAFDDLDTGDENTGLGLPSGDHDLPMVFQDKIFDIGGALIFDPFNGDGFLGDTFVVNGVVQPYHDVERRKYRLRFLNGSNARIYQMCLTNDSGRSYPMTQIATEGGLMAKPLPVPSFELSMAQRVEVVVDFADPMFNDIAATDKPFVYIENRMAQTDGRKPDGLVSAGPKLLRFRLSGNPVPTPPVPSVLRPFARISDAELAAAERRSFRFDRSDGVFTINGEPIDIDKKNVVPRNVGQLWHFQNDSGGWWHPNHVHSELMRVIRHNGQPPPLNETDGMARKDTVVMRKNESVDVYIKFRDFSGPFVFHCHNLEHEDHAMMGRFDVE